MGKYILKKKWVEWCHSCGHGFKVDAGGIESVVKVDTLGFIGKLLGRKPNVTTEDIKPKPSSCTVCGKSENVTVIELQEDKIAVPDNSN